MSSPDNRPRRGRPPQADRPNLIADAAIRLLAENGSRSLSHRRVDKEAGLPIGSTIHHAPTRNDLLLIAARRLSEISRRELQPFSDYVREKGQELTAEDVATGVMNLWQPRLGADQFYRLRAEMTVLLSQDFEAELRALFQPQIDAVTQFWQETMALLGSRHPEEAGFEFMLWSRGLLYMLAMRGGFADDREFHQIEKWITRFLKALVKEEEHSS